MEEPRTFNVKVFEALKDRIRELGLEVPELEAVAVTCLWRFPDQTALPSHLLIGVDGPVIHPDQLLRLELLTLRLAGYLLEQATHGTLALQEMANSLARKIIDEQTSRTTTAPQPTTPDTLHGPVHPHGLCPD